VTATNPEKIAEINNPIASTGNFEFAPAGACAKLTSRLGLGMLRLSVSKSVALVWRSLEKASIPGLSARPLLSCRLFAGARSHLRFRRNPSFDVSL